MDDQVDHIAGQTVAFVSAFFSAIGCVFSPQLLALTGATPGTHA